MSTLGSGKAVCKKSSSGKGCSYRSVRCDNLSNDAGAIPVFVPYPIVELFRKFALLFASPELLVITIFPPVGLLKLAAKEASMAVCAVSK